MSSFIDCFGKATCDPSAGRSPSGEEVRILQAWIKSPSGFTYKIKKPVLSEDATTTSLARNGR